MIYFLNELWNKWINDFTIFVVNNFIGVFHIMNSIIVLLLKIQNIV